MIVAISYNITYRVVAWQDKHGDPTGRVVRDDLESLPEALALWETMTASNPELNWVIDLKIEKKITQLPSRT